MMQAIIPVQLTEETRKMGQSKEILFLEYYLIDTENLGREWTELLDACGNAVYHIFYTDNSAAIPLESVERLLQLNGRLRWIKCCIGANALDFQLVTQLGYLLASTPDGQYHIVSKDTGYDAVVKFWTEQGMMVDRIGQVNVNTEETVLPQSTELENLCWAAVKHVATEGEARKIAEIIRTVTGLGRTDYKTAVHTELVKVFEQPRGSKIYHACKRIIIQAYLNPVLRQSA